MKDAGAKASGKIDRSDLSSTGTAPLDYGNPALWACLPGNDPNECHTNLTATEIRKDGTREEVPHTVADAPKFDCFYIYPTVATQGGGNMMDFSNIAPVLDPSVRTAGGCSTFSPSTMSTSGRRTRIVSGSTS